MTDQTASSAEAVDASGAPARAGLILATLIIVAAVANLPLAMANVALVFFCFPKRDREREMLAEYHQQDMAAIQAMEG